MRNMSTIILRKPLPGLDAKDNRVFTVNNKEPETLADFVQRIRAEKRLSLSDVERQSGGQITDGYVSRIENGYILNVTPKKLVALAKGLGVSEDEVFAVARGKTTSGDLAFDELRMLELYRLLPPEKRLEAIAHLEVLFQFHKRGHEPRRHPATSTSTGSSKRSEKKRA
jgi:transcriptional regulator with XRE-family HTH domain